MQTKASYDVTFHDGTEVRVSAKSKRMARAKASVKARKQPDQIDRCQRYPAPIEPQRRNYGGFDWSFGRRPRWL